MIKRLTSIFFAEESVSESITQSAILIASLGIVSRFLGLIRDRILAAKFGAGDTLDIYYAAFKIPDFIYGLLILGAVSAAFVPVFTKLISQKKTEESWKLVSQLITVILIGLSFLSLILFLLTPYLVKGLTIGFSQEKRDLVIELTRVMLLSPVILGISAIMGGVLNSFRKFFFFSLAPIFYNLGIIIGVVWLTEFFGTIGLAEGVILGASFHFLIQLPEVLRSGFKFSLNFDFNNPYLKKVFWLMIPRMLGGLVGQINLIVITVLASTLSAGSLAVFTLANNLQSVSLGLFGISFAVAAFPTLSALWSQGNKKEFIYRFNGTLRKIIFFIVPISALVFVLRAQLVRVTLGTGRFDWEDTLLTLEALGIFAFSLWAQSIIPLLARTFYAIEDTLTPFLVGLFSAGVNVFLALLLIKDNYMLIWLKGLNRQQIELGDFRILGLVLAFSISSIVNAGLLFLVLKIKMGKINGRRLLNLSIKIIVATTVMIIITQAVKQFIGAEPFGEEVTFLGVLTQLTVASLIGGGVYLFLMKLMKVEEASHFSRMIKKIIQKKMSYNSK